VEVVEAYIKEFQEAQDLVVLVVVGLVELLVEVMAFKIQDLVEEEMKDLHGQQLMQVLVVPVSSSSHILHKYSKSINQFKDTG
jgi:hypothetical protein